MAHSTDIVGYMFKADIYCPEHIIEAMTSTEDFEGWGLAEGVEMSVEENLNEIAAAFATDRQDESSFDSDEFPKVIFAGMGNEDVLCSVCGEIIA